HTSLTQRMADEYPNWTEIRNNKESNGQLFLNYFGIELETVHEYLEWIQEQKYIHTADLHSYDWIYMYPLPSVSPTDTIRIHQFTQSGNTREVPLLNTIHEFFY